MPGREVKGDAMLRVAQECFTRPLGSEHTRFAFDAEVGLEAAGASNEADNGLGEVDVEIVADNVPPCVGSGATDTTSIAA